MLLGALVALLWAGADIGASYVPLSPLRTTLVAQCVGLLALIFTSALFLWRMPDFSLQLYQLPWPFMVCGGMAMGALSAITYLALYFALNKGPLALVSPLVSSQGAVTFLGALLLLGEHAMPNQMVLLLIVMVGIVAVTLIPSAKPETVSRSRWTSSLLAALVASFGFGGQSLALGAMSTSYGFMASLVFLLIQRAFSVFFVVILATFATDATTHKVPLASWWLAGLSGLLELLGLVFFAFSTMLLTNTFIVGVLASSYPLYSLLYGLLVRRERPTSIQFVGVLGIIVGTITLSFDVPLLISIGLLLCFTIAISFCRRRHDLSVVEASKKGHIS